MPEDFNCQGLETHIPLYALDAIDTYWADNPVIPHSLLITPRDVLNVQNVCSV